LACEYVSSSDRPIEQAEFITPSEIPVPSSNLPLVLIDTLGEEIPSDPKIDAWMRVIDVSDDGRAYVDEDGDFILYDGRIGIETRGASSLDFPKKQYQFETRDEEGEDLKIEPFGLPEEADWILHAPYSDKSLMRNYLAYWISNQVGLWAVHSRFVEAYIDQEDNPYIDEEYVGVMLFMEKIKRDKARVPIQKLEEHHNSEPEITGGYIVKLDHGTSSQKCFYYPTSEDSRQCLQFVEPKRDEVTKEQWEWMQDYFARFESVLESDRFDDPDEGYAAYIEVPSFVDYFILHELFRNNDGLRRSAFMHKDRGGKLVMGPYWDCNLCMGNASYHDGWKTSGWGIKSVEKQAPGVIPFWWWRLLEDDSFVQAVINRWWELRETVLRSELVFGKIDEVTEELDEAQERNFNRWPILGIRIWPNPAPIATSYQEEVENLRQWIDERFTWLDKHIEELGELER
jgi:hypothetical protein